MYFVDQIPEMERILRNPERNRYTKLTMGFDGWHRKQVHAEIDLIEADWSMKTFENISTAGCL